MAFAGDVDARRRVSARARKPTAKAQALSGSRLLPKDSANLPDAAKSATTATTPNLAMMNSSSSSSSSSGSDWVAESKASMASSSATTAELGNDDNDNDVATTANETAKRASRRERKPSAKLLELELEPNWTRPSRKRPLAGPRPSDEGPPRYRMREKRKPTARGGSSLGDEPLNKALEARTTRSTASRSRRVSSAAMSEAPRVRSSKRTTVTTMDGDGKKTASTAAAASRPVEPLSVPQVLRKHPKQGTRSTGAGSATAPPGKASASAGPAELRNATSEAPYKRRRHAKAEAPTPRQSHTMPASQTRLILTVPLPLANSSTAQSSSTAATTATRCFPAAQVRKAEFVDRGCQLFCLDASSRILAFAEIAAELPDADSTGSGATADDSALYETWLEHGRSRFCVCGKPLDTSVVGGGAAVRSVLTEDELTHFLAPNQNAKDDDDDDKYKKEDGVATSQGPSSKAPLVPSSKAPLVFPRVNSIVKASEGRRVSALYKQVIAGSATSPSPAPGPGPGPGPESDGRTRRLSRKTQETLPTLWHGMGPTKWAPQGALPA